MKNTGTWSKSSWHNFTALQQPKWPDKGRFDEIIQTLSVLPPLVFAGEIRDLKAMLAKAVKGDAFLLQGGDCSEEFSRCTAPNIRDTEIVNGQELPSYRGDMANSAEPVLESRIPDPERLLKGYHMSAATMNLLRAFTRGGFSS